MPRKGTSSTGASGAASSSRRNGGQSDQEEAETVALLKADEAKRKAPPVIVIESVFIGEDDMQDMAFLLSLDPRAIAKLTTGAWDKYDGSLEYELPAWILELALPSFHVRIKWARLNIANDTWRCVVRAKILFMTKKGKLGYARGCDYCEAVGQLCLYEEGKTACPPCQKKKIACSAGGRVSEKFTDDFKEYLDGPIGFKRNPRGSTWETPRPDPHKADFEKTYPEQFIMKKDQKKAKKMAKLQEKHGFFIPDLPALPEVSDKPTTQEIDAFIAAKAAARKYEIECDKRIYAAQGLFKDKHGYTYPPEEQSQPEDDSSQSRHNQEQLKRMATEIKKKREQQERRDLRRLAAEQGGDEYEDSSEEEDEGEGDGDDNSGDSDSDSDSSDSSNDDDEQPGGGAASTAEGAGQEKENDGDNGAAESAAGGDDGPHGGPRRGEEQTSAPNPAIRDDESPSPLRSRAQIAAEAAAKAAADKSAQHTATGGEASKSKKRKSKDGQGGSEDGSAGSSGGGKKKRRKEKQKAGGGGGGLLGGGGGSLLGGGGGE